MSGTAQASRAPAKMLVSLVVSVAYVCVYLFSRVCVCLLLDFLT